MLVVIDTNILVSALLSPNGSPARILDYVLNGQIIPCYDSRILVEYEAVLSRPKFRIASSDLRKFIDFIKDAGLSVVPTPIATPFVDEADKKFYEVAKQCHAFLITGNLKHFPKDDIVIGATDFLSVLQ